MHHHWNRHPCHSSPRISTRNVAIAQFFLRILWPAATMRRFTYLKQLHGRIRRRTDWAAVYRIHNNSRLFINKLPTLGARNEEDRGAHPLVPARPGPFHSLVNVSIWRQRQGGNWLGVRWRGCLCPAWLFLFPALPPHPSGDPDQSRCLFRCVGIRVTVCIYLFSQTHQRVYILL